MLTKLRNSILYLITAASFCVNVDMIYAATYYVNAGGDNDANGLSWNYAFETIQEGIDSSSNGDFVIVGTGIYYETIDFTGKQISVTSTDPNDWEGVVKNTIIDANDITSGAVTFGDYDMNSKICGFTITGGQEGVRCGSNSETGIYNCILKDNYVSGLLSSVNSKPTIHNNYVFGNQFGIVGGVHSDADISNCVVFDNDYGLVFGGFETTCQIFNCTIVRNSCGIYSQLNPIDANSCIVWDCTDCLYNCTATYSCVEDPNDAIGVGNISIAPYFVDSDANDFRLLPNSPCIDRADGILGVDRDILGLIRIDDRNASNNGNGLCNYADIGAYEYLGVEVKQIMFNYNTISDVDDGINLRDRYDDVDLITDAGPEWQKDNNHNSPAGFIKDSSIDIKVRLEVTTDDEISLTIKGDSIGNDEFPCPQNTIVQFNDGVSQVQGTVNNPGDPNDPNSYVIFSLDQNTPNYVCKKEVDWQWSYSPTNSSSPIGTDLSGPHTFYTIVDSPNEILIDCYGGDEIYATAANAEILDYACGWTEGATSRRQACEYIIDNGFAKHYYYFGGSCAQLAENFMLLVSALGVDVQGADHSVYDGFTDTIKLRALQGGTYGFTSYLPIQFGSFGSHTWSMVKVESIQDPSLLVWNQYDPTFALYGLSDDSTDDPNDYANYIYFGTDATNSIGTSNNSLKWWQLAGMPFDDNFTKNIIINGVEKINDSKWKHNGAILDDVNDFCVIPNSVYLETVNLGYAWNFNTLDWRNIHVKYRFKTDNYDANDLIVEYRKAPDNWVALAEEKSNGEWSERHLICDPNANCNPHFILRFKSQADDADAVAMLDYVEMYGEQWCGLPFGGDGFEGGNLDFGGVRHGKWNYSDVNDVLVCEAAKCSDNYGLKLSGADGWIEKAIGTDGNYDITVEYSRELNLGNDPNAKLFVEYFAGPNWLTIEEVTINSDPNYTAGLQEHVLGWSASDNSEFKLRFRINSYNENTYAYIDDVLITGKPLDNTYDNWINDGEFKSWFFDCQSFGDANGDGRIDDDDISLFIDAFNTASSQPNYNPNADFNRDYMVNGLDVMYLNNNLNKECQECK